MAKSSTKKQLDSPSPDRQEVEPAAVTETPTAPQANIFAVLKPYKWLIAAVLLTTSVTSGLALMLPWLIGQSIDKFTAGQYHFESVAIIFSLLIVGILVFAYLQNIIQAFTAEKVARDLRQQLSHKIAHQSYLQIQNNDPAKLLTNITSDVDNVKLFVGSTVSMAISSLFMLVMASIILIVINWKLGLAVLVIIPLIGGTFGFVFGKASKLFISAQEVIDKLNAVINQTIMGSALIRVLYSNHDEIARFSKTNQESLSIGLKIVQLFAIIIPSVGFFANLAVLIILVYGGYQVINEQMTLGDLTAFNGYLGLIIWPIIMLGIMSSMMAEASASYGRVAAVLAIEPPEHTGTLDQKLSGHVQVQNLGLTHDQKQVLKDINFDLQPGSKTAIIGPTAAGKSQLLYTLAGLIPPTNGAILYDDQPLEQLDKKSFYQQVGLVFQDSSVFNLSLEQNIAFNNEVGPTELDKAIEAADLTDFINNLPQGLQTVVSERGSSLSGGQKQRLMLARALALNPSVLLLDDFTARVDINTEAKIIANIKRLYPQLTLISVTQKITSIDGYDQILLLMDGELLARGTHKQLLKSSPDYVQIYNSQQSLNTYELQAD